MKNYYTTFRKLSSLLGVETQVAHAAKAMLVVNDNLHIVLQGYRFAELKRFDNFLDRIHVADAKPVKYAQVFRKVEPGIRTATGQYRKDAYKNLVLENVEYRKNELQRILAG